MILTPDELVLLFFFASLEFVDFLCFDLEFKIIFSISSSFLPAIWISAAIAFRLNFSGEFEEFLVNS